MSATEKWLNNDGLEVRFGSEKRAVHLGGSPKTYGDLQELRVTINGADVPTTDAPVDKKLALPPGAYIESATFVVTAAFVGATGQLDLGLMNDDGDGTFSTLDDDGLDAVIAVTAIDAIDDRIVCDGAQINTSPVNSTDATLPMVVSAGYQTAAFTAGSGELIIKYRLV